MKYLFGPVPSRRLGLSLGVDLVPYKVCSFDCVYCECGRTTVHTLVRREYVPVEKVLKELESFMKEPTPFHYVTFSGYGEPTLNIGFAKVAHWIKEHVDRPLALLTNSSLLIHDNVRAEVTLCNLILPSLDAATQKTFERINRPVDGMLVKDIVEALRLFRIKYPSVKMELEILFVKGFNTHDEEIKALKSAIEYIEPHEVHLNTVDRPPTEDVEAVDMAFLEEVRSFFGGNTKIIGAGASCVILEEKRVKEAIASAVSRRPLRFSDIMRLVGMDELKVRSVVESLKKEGKIEELSKNGQIFYRRIGGRT